MLTYSFHMVCSNSDSHEGHHESMLYSRMQHIVYKRTAPTVLVGAPMPRCKKVVMRRIMSKFAYACVGLVGALLLANEQGCMFMMFMCMQNGFARL